MQQGILGHLGQQATPFPIVVPYRFQRPALSTTDAREGYALVD